jgi:DNA gyrase subunit A
VNVVDLAEDEKIASCRAIRDFDAPDHYLVMATRNGLVKKTPLSAYGRPRNGGIIAIKLRDDDEIIDVLVAKAGDEIVFSTANGMAIRFLESDARPMGRNTSGVKGITLTEGDAVIGMVVADPEATLLTACEKGYGKRTLFGPNSGDAEGEEGEDSVSSSNRYRAQKRGGKGVRDIKTTDRNGKVIGIKSVNEEDELLLMTSRGKIQRIKCADINTIGRNTQGVRIMSLDEGDSLAVIARVPRDEEGDDEALDSPTQGTDGGAPAATPPASEGTPDVASDEADSSESPDESSDTGDAEG